MCISFNRILLFSPAFKPKITKKRITHLMFLATEKRKKINLFKFKILVLLNPFKELSKID